MTYAYLEQRMAQNYIDMLPPFVPDKNAPVSAGDQERFYNLVNNLYRLAYDEPLLFVSALNADDAFPNRFNKKSYGKPQLQIEMKKFNKSVESLLQNMFFLGRGDDVKLNKRQQIILSKLGIDGAGLPPAWVWMATRDGAHMAAFSYCLFDQNHPYTIDIYARLLGESSFKKLTDWMLAQGYKRYDIYDVAASDCRLSLTVANPKWSDEAPNGGFEYRMKHTGISARLDPYIKNPAVFGLCIPNGLMGKLIESFDAMDARLKSFFIKQTKKCNDCNYCIQTDTTGARPKALIPVTHDGKNYGLCTYFPGYYYCWTRIDDGLAEVLINMLSFMDTFV